jgi:hypothetical protein
VEAEMVEVNACDWCAYWCVDADLQGFCAVSLYLRVVDVEQAGSLGPVARHEVSIAVEGERDADATHERRESLRVDAGRESGCLVGAANACAAR